jgi:hypothetical protein
MFNLRKIKTIKITLINKYLKIKLKFYENKIYIGNKNSSSFGEKEKSFIKTKKKRKKR